MATNREWGGVAICATRKKKCQGRLSNRVLEPTDPLPGITKRIGEKTKKAYDTSGADETWLAIFAGASQPVALASTFIFKLAVNCSKLNEQTGDMLKTSLFSRYYLHCAMTESA